MRGSALHRPHLGLGLSDSFRLILQRPAQKVHELLVRNTELHDSICSHLRGELSAHTLQLVSPSRPTFSHRWWV